MVSKFSFCLPLIFGIWYLVFGIWNFMYRQMHLASVLINLICELRYSCCLFVFNVEQYLLHCFCLFVCLWIWNTQRQVVKVAKVDQQQQRKDASCYFINKLTVPTIVLLQSPVSVVWFGKRKSSLFCSSILCQKHTLVGQANNNYQQITLRNNKKINSAKHATNNINNITRQHNKCTKVNKQTMPVTNTKRMPGNFARRTSFPRFSRLLDIYIHTNMYLFDQASAFFPQSTCLLSVLDMSKAYPLQPANKQHTTSLVLYVVASIPFPICMQQQQLTTCQRNMIHTTHEANRK